MKYCYFLFGFILCCRLLNAQTQISGIIDSDSTLSIHNSPYLVNNNLVISPDGNVTIEPGVEVRFSSGVGLEVRGTLIANGTFADSITFTSESSAEKGSWGGIDINYTGAYAEFSYCKFLYASNAIHESTGDGIPVSHCRFSNNVGGMGGSSSNNNTTIDSCQFTDNTYGITGGHKIVSNSVFTNGSYGISGSGTYIYNSTFRSNSIAALRGGGGEIDSCTIEDNGTGIEQGSTGFRVTNSIISDNDTGIVRGITYSDNMNPVENNMICNNTTYNIVNKSNRNLEFYDNCWCTSDSAAIEDKIFDGWDNSAYGLVDYTIFKEDCITPILKTIKEFNQAVYFTGLTRLIAEETFMYPNPAKETLYIKNINFGNIYIEIMDFSGRVLLSTEKDIIDISELGSGIYLISIKIDNYFNINRLAIIK